MTTPQGTEEADIDKKADIDKLIKLFREMEQAKFNLMMKEASLNLFGSEFKEKYGYDIDSNIEPKTGKEVKVK